MTCLYLVLVLSFVCHQCFAEQQFCLSASGCKCLGENFTVDFSHAFSYPISVNDTGNPKYYYVISPCDAVSSCGSEVNKTSDSAVCQFNQNATGAGSFICGRNSYITWIIDTANSFTVIYTNGDLTYNNFTRMAVFQIVVNRTIQSSSLQFLGQKNDNRRKTITYTFRVDLTPSAASGGTDSKGVSISTGGIVGIVISSSLLLILLALTVYCVIGALINTAKGAQGKEVVPLPLPCKRCLQAISVDGNYHLIQD